MGLQPNLRNQRLDQQNWLIFEDVVADGNGHIVLQGSKTIADFNSHIVNAVRVTSTVTVIPEPSTTALFGGIGLLPLLCWRAARQRRLR